MGRRVAHLFGAALLVLAVGCRSKPLQELDGGAGVIIPSDAMIHPIGDGGVSDVGPAKDAGGAIDAPWNVTFAGRRSFLVTSAAQTEGGIASGISHTFTMTLDTDRRIAIIGKDGDTEVVPVEQQTGGVLHVVGRCCSVSPSPPPVAAPCCTALSTSRSTRRAPRCRASAAER